MEERLQRDICAEIALSAMVSMIMIILFSAIVAGMSLMMIEQAFMESRTQSTEQSETLNSIPVVLVFEVENYDDTGNTNDRLYLMFKFPLAMSAIPDVNVKWAMMCDINDTNPTITGGSDRTLIYSSGDFDAATELTDSGLDDTALDAFEPTTYYHVILELDSPDGAGECDLVPEMKSTLVIAVENGRTAELDFELPTEVHSGYDLMS